MPMMPVPFEVPDDEDDGPVHMAHRVQGKGDYAGQEGYLLALGPGETCTILWDGEDGAERLPYNVYYVE